MSIRTIDVELPTADFAEIYRTVDGIDLGIHFYQPADAKSPTPAVVFYFGGGWRSGGIGQFRHQSEYLKQRGVTCCLVEYRIKSKHNVTPYACVEDGRSAMRYVREHAARLNIDLDRICASGGSAGGHVAANTALAQNCDAADDNLSIDPTPAAMFLFNPVLDTVVESWQARSHNDTVNSLLEDFGTRGADVSPIHQAKSGLMPVRIIHGEDDATVPFEQATDFAQRMKDADNDCHVIGYPGYGHGFFNYRDGKKPQAFIDTLERMDDFLKHLGWIQGDAFVKDFVQTLEVQ